MAQANVFFLYDIDTEKLLGFTAFEGTFKHTSLSEDKRGFVMEVDNFSFLPFDGSIVPTVKDGVIYLEVYEILENCDSTAVDVEVIPLPCGPHPKYFAELMIPRFAEQARSEIKNLRAQAERRAKRRAKQLANQITLMKALALSSKNKWLS
ncbi:hypothetical protein IJL65_02745 [bacterium]|nr:hypothetical protein [bacterium]